MPLPKGTRFTSEDYWNLPEGRRAELIDGRLYDMTPPSRIHQKLVSMFVHLIQSHVRNNSGSCEVYPAPFAVNLDAEDRDWVEPDVSVICDKNKLTDRGCTGAPSRYSVWNSRNCSALSHQGCTFNSPRTPWVLTMRPASR